MISFHNLDAKYFFPATFNSVISIITMFPLSSWLPVQADGSL